MSYTLPNGKEITSEVLMKISPAELPALPMACKVCPAAMWQLTGNVEKPLIRCFCRVMHSFTWDSRNQEEVLDCDMIYQPEEEEETLGNTTQTSLPPFLASQLSQLPSEEPVTDLGPEWEEETPDL